MPAWMAYGFASALVPVLVTLTLRREKRVAAQGRGMGRNLRIVFRDEWTPKRERRLIWRWARHLLWLVVDFVRMSKITADNVAEYVDLTAINAHADLFLSEKGLLCYSAHAGCWELQSHAATVSGLPTSVIARPFAAPLLNEFAREIRTAGGAGVIEKWGALWGVMKALNRGENLGILADEDVRDRPLFVPFLGTMASANPALAQLHLSTGAPILVITCQRIARERFRFRTWGVVRVEPTGDRERDRLAVLEAVSARLSRAILSTPEQWLWGSRRFHTRPPEEVAGSDGLPPPVEGDREYIAVAARRLDR